MKRITTFVSVAAAFFAAACGRAAGQALLDASNDSLTIGLGAVEVRAIRVAHDAPVAHSELYDSDISRANYGRDQPFMLQGLPSVVATSEAGTGIGGTKFRLRGSDASRINVTMNGVPLNDAESHSVYWYDTPDLISSVSSAQLQRGAGTSTNGAGAFGGSLNLVSASLPPRAGGEVAFSAGSYGTNKELVGFSSGLLGGRWAFGANYSHVGSDGYVDRASANLHTYRFQAAWGNGTTALRFLSFGGHARVGLAYSGVDADQLLSNRRYNPEGEMRDAEGNVMGYYKEHTDNYTQSNNHLTLSHTFNAHWNAHITAHYTRGYGYYEQYKNSATLQEYGLAIEGVEESNLVRRKKMNNDFGGFVSSTNYRASHVRLSLGAAYNVYGGNHWGEVIRLYEAPDFVPREYYRNHSTKHDVNFFTKITWQPVRQLSLYGDVQYRYIRHRISGLGDNYDETAASLQVFNVDRKYGFFNPKLGAFYAFGGGHEVYASFSMASKEPTRTNLTDTKDGQLPSDEHLCDFEAGYRYGKKKVKAEVNIYYYIPVGGINQALING